MLDTACSALKAMTTVFATSGVMLPDETAMVQHAKALLSVPPFKKGLPFHDLFFFAQDVEGLRRIFGTNGKAAAEEHALVVTIVQRVWAMGEMADDVAQNCFDSTLVEQIHLYKRAARHYGDLLALACTLRLMPRPTGTTAPLPSEAWPQLPVAVFGLCGSVNPLLRAFFLACLLQTEPEDRKSE